MNLAEARTTLAAVAAEPGEGLRPLPTIQQALAVVAIELLDRTDGDPKYSSSDPLIKRLSDQAGLLGRAAAVLDGFARTTRHEPVRKALANATGDIDTLIRIEQDAREIVAAIDERLGGSDAGRLQATP